MIRYGQDCHDGRSMWCLRHVFFLNRDHHSWTNDGLMIWLGIVEPKKGPSTFNQHIKDRNLSNTNRNCTWLKSLGKLAGDSLASRTLASGNQVDVDFPACVLLPDGRFFTLVQQGVSWGILAIALLSGKFWSASMGWKRTGCFEKGEQQWTDQWALETNTSLGRITWEKTTWYLDQSSIDHCFQSY